MDGARAGLAARQAVSRLLEPGPVIIACSGGSDSLALARAVGFEARRAGAVPTAIIVDHGILPDSAARARWARDQLDGVMAAEIMRVDAVGPGGPEGAARQARYGALAAAARARNNAPVFLGHTADDQAETVLLGLGRGSGARSVAGMRERAALPTDSELTCIRPLLHLSRTDLRAALKYWDQDWLEDPGNRADGPWRTASGEALVRAAIREEALPALSRALGKDARWPLVRTAELLADDEELLSQLAGELYERARTFEETSGTWALQVAELRGVHRALRRRVVRLWLLAAGARPGQLTSRHIHAVDDLLTAGRGSGVDLPGLRASRTPLFIVRAWDNMAEHDNRKDCGGRERYGDGSGSSAVKRRGD
ncbi:MAG: tRNA lysidine(34) synthetase TilS [Flaviflexus sp.]|nr:tRNA lysidine(34) synthetase TilS [Flaviflexus sp.]